jgi:hypothetical protein
MKPLPARAPWGYGWASDENVIPSFSHFYERWRRTVRDPLFRTPRGAQAKTGFDRE